MWARESSDQPEHSPTLVRVFAVHMTTPWVLSYPLSTQLRFWSDWAHTPLCWFCHEAALLINTAICLGVQTIRIFLLPVWSMSSNLRPGRTHCTDCLSLLTCRVTFNEGYALKNVNNKWSTSWKNLLLQYANNKGADQPAHLCSLISTFVVRCLDSIIPLVSISELPSLYLASVAAQVGLSLPWSQTLKTGFLEMLKWAKTWKTLSSELYNKERLKPTCSTTEAS